MIASAEDILNCQLKEWFPNFQRISLKTQVINLSDTFLEYLGEDGIILPVEADQETCDHISDDEDLHEIETTGPTDTRTFPELTEKIRAAISEFGGNVFIKLNWSAPVDSAWAIGGTMKCCTAADVYMLLKSSNRITFDIEHMFDLCNDPTSGGERICTSFDLVIRKWANLNPSMEFRIFIGNGRIIGASQRDCTTFYPFLSTERDHIKELLTTFFMEFVDGKFPLDFYTIDVYIDKRKRVWIIDFNPFGSPTCPLLFEWEGLISLCQRDVADIGDAYELILIENQSSVFSSSKGSARGPIDVTQAPDIGRFMEICREQSRNSGESSDDNCS